MLCFDLFVLFLFPSVFFEKYNNINVFKLACVLLTCGNVNVRIETTSSLGKNERISARKNTLDPFYIFKYTHLPPFSIIIIAWQFTHSLRYIRYTHVCAYILVMSSSVFCVVFFLIRKKLNQQNCMKNE